MKIIDAGYCITSPLDGTAILKNIESAARTCYKSEDRITEYSAMSMVMSLIKHGHEAMLEHEYITVRFICDRGVSHEIVRHRVASFAQESTRYCNYSKDKFGNEITVIRPCYFAEDTENYRIWKASCEAAEKAYFALLDSDASPQEARSVLPTSLKTEIVMTANLREWRHFFRLRTSEAAHPQMRELTIPLLRELKSRIPIIFDDIEVKQD